MFDTLMNIGSDLTFLIWETLPFFGHRNSLNTFGQFVLINDAVSCLVIWRYNDGRGGRVCAEYGVNELIFSLNHRYQLCVCRF